MIEMLVCVSADPSFMAYFDASITLLEIVLEKFIAAFS